MSDATSRRIGPIVADDGDWIKYAPGTVYRCEVYVSREGDGVKAEAALPDVSAIGASEREALDAVIPLATEAVRAYKASGRKIPWQNRQPVVGETMKVITVQP